MLTYLGQQTFGQLAPLCLTMNSQLAAVIGMALSQLGAQVTGLTKVSLALKVKPPGFDATLRGVQQVILNLRATGPSITLQGAAVLDIIAGLRLQIKALQAMVQIPMGGAIHGYWYSGSAAAYGGELAASTSGGFPGGRPTDHVQSILLAATEPASIVILKTVFKAPP